MDGCARSAVLEQRWRACVGVESRALWDGGASHSRTFQACVCSLTSKALRGLNPISGLEPRCLCVYSQGSGSLPEVYVVPVRAAAVRPVRSYMIISV